MTNVDPDTEKEFLAIAERIADLARVRLARNEKIAALRERERVLYARHTLAVATERDPGGKPKYSNEAVRQAELTVRWADDVEAQKLRAEVAELDHLQENLAVDHNLLVDRKALVMLKLGLAPRPGEEIPV